jgi:hypothetical protein
VSSKQLKPLSRLTAGLLALPLLLIACSQCSPVAPSEAHGPTLQPAATGAIIIRPGDIIQKLVDARPAGTAFLIKAGVHRRQSVKPKNGMTFVGEPGAILDGGGVTKYAFVGATTSDVTIRGLVIEKYAPPLREGAIDAPDTDRWLIENTEIRYSIADYPSSYCAPQGCGGMGIRIGNRMIVRNSKMHHNDQYGIGGSGDDVLIEDSEIAYNNYRDRVTHALKGATKFVKTHRLVFRNNYSHHNHGDGFWTDVDNAEVLVEGNVIEANYGSGIFHEIGYSAVIRNNEVRGNGHAGTSWLYGAGILVAHSANVEVYGNLVEGNRNGIVGIQQSRDSHHLINLWVHDNTIRMDEGGSGVGKGEGATFDPYSSSANNRFDGNDYRVSGSLTKPFRWDGMETWTGWRGHGQDLHGTLTVVGS